MNSLEGIQDALEIRYATRPDGQQIVGELMNKIVDMLVLDIVLKNPDRNIFNWTIAEYPDGRVDLVPVYDHSRILKNSPVQNTHLELTIENHRGSFQDSNTLLESVIRTLDEPSVKKIRDHLVDSLWVLKRTKLENVFSLIKKQTGCLVSKKVREEYYEKGENHLSFLMKTRGIEELPVYKKTSFETILAMTNPCQYDDGEIAVTVITPNETIHATSTEGYLSFHEDLLGELYKDTYKTGIDVRGNTIEIRHAVYDEHNHQAFVEIPKYITDREYDELFQIITGLSAHGAVILSSITGFDPISKRFEAEPPRQYEGLEILEVLKNSNHVVEYDWPFEPLKTTKNKNI